MICSGMRKNNNRVRARVPEKQGLKLQKLARIGSRWSRPGASSRKTRIETELGFMGKKWDGCPGASSRKTRIETREIAWRVLRRSRSGREFQKNKD